MVQYTLNNNVFKFGAFTMSKEAENHIFNQSQQPVKNKLQGEIGP